MEEKLDQVEVMAGDEKSMAVVRKEAGKVTSPLMRELEGIEIVDAESYQSADKFLGKCRAAIKIVDEKLDPIIEPIRKGLDKLYALKRELHEPLDDAVKAVKGKMAKWQLEEKRKRDEEEKKRREEEQRLVRLAEERERAGKSTAVVEKRLEALQEEAEKPVEVVRGKASSVRFVKKWRVTDLRKLVCAVADMDVPIEVLTVDARVMQEKFEENRPEVAAWPGVEMYEDVGIAGRG